VKCCTKSQPRCPRPCCYDDAHSDVDCMQKKPEQVTGNVYSSTGWEIQRSRLWEWRGSGASTAGTGRTVIKSEGARLCISPNAGWAL